MFFGCPSHRPGRRHQFPACDSTHRRTGRHCLYSCIRFKKFYLFTVESNFLIRITNKFHNSSNFALLILQEEHIYRQTGPRLRFSSPNSGAAKRMRGAAARYARLPTRPRRPAPRGFFPFCVALLRNFGASIPMVGFSETHLRFMAKRKTARSRSSIFRPARGPSLHSVRNVVRLEIGLENFREYFPAMSNLG